MLSQRRRVRKGLKSSPILPVSEQTPPKDETVPGPDNGLLARLANSQRPAFVELPATIYWSANLQSQIKSRFKMGSLIGRGSGESFPLAFHTPGQT